MNRKKLQNLNAQLLQRQFLSKRARGHDSPVQVAEQTVGINSQDFLESISSFWTRIDKFENSQLFSEFKPHGGLVRTWTVRGTMHTIPSKDYYTHIFGARARRYLQWYDRVARNRKIPDRFEDRQKLFYDPLLDKIQGSTISTTDLEQFMMDKLTEYGYKARMKLNRGWHSGVRDGPSWTGMREMAYRGLLVNAGRKGLESLWMPAKDWLNTRKQPDPEETVVDLIRKYIENYGPVTRSDILYWSYLLTKTVNKALETLRPDLVVEHLDIGKEPYYSINGVESSTIDPVPRVILLPEFDSLMMGHKDKSRYLPIEHKGKVFFGFAGIRPAVLLNGFAVGIWRKTRSKTGLTMLVSPFRKLNSREKNWTQEEFQRYGEYLDSKLSVRFQSLIA